MESFLQQVNQYSNLILVVITMIYVFLIGRMVRGRSTLSFHPKLTGDESFTLKESYPNPNTAIGSCVLQQLELLYNPC
jgi:hypothetical protein